MYKLKMPARKKSRRGFHFRKNATGIALHGSDCLEVCPTGNGTEATFNLEEANINFSSGYNVPLTARDVITTRPRGGDGIFLAERTVALNSSLGEQTIHDAEEWIPALSPQLIYEEDEPSLAPDIQDNMNESVADIIDVDEHLYLEPDRYCRNCLRSSGVYVDLLTVAKSDIKFRKKFCFVTKDEGDELGIILCDNCKRYLLSEDTQWEDMWPIWVRTILLDNIVLEHFVDVVWKFLPGMFRTAWLPYLAWKHEPYRTVTLLHPLPHFEDLTETF